MGFFLGVVGSFLGVVGPVVGGPVGPVVGGLVGPVVGEFVGIGVGTELVIMEPEVTVGRGIIVEFTELDLVGCVVLDGVDGVGVLVGMGAGVVEAEGRQAPA